MQGIKHVVEWTEAGGDQHVFELLALKMLKTAHCYEKHYFLLLEALVACKIDI